jgi:RsiW-degrading membrane proteinase PrsW (M82 family)
MRQRVEGFTWRRGSVAFVGGATVGVVIAMVLEILLPVVVLALVLGLGDVVSRNVERLLDALAGKNIASALASPGFIYVFVQIAILAPLAEEFAKPLITLPLMRRLSQREAFLTAAMAGAGFAAVENVLRWIRPVLWADFARGALWRDSPGARDCGPALARHYEG